MPKGKGMPKKGGGGKKATKSPAGKIPKKGGAGGTAKPKKSTAISGGNY